MARRGIANTPLPGGGRLADTLIWRDRVFFMGSDGTIFEWGGRRWYPLVADTKFGAKPRLPPRRRRQGYAGHPGFAGKAR